MNKNIIIVAIVAFALLGVGALWYKSGGEAPAPVAPPPSDSTVPPATPPTPDPSSSETESGRAAAEIKNYEFSPKVLVVKKGTTVTWTNKDSAAHTVTEVASGFDSGLMKQNVSWSYTFNETGKFDYYCKPHPSMKAVVEVVE